MVSIAAFRWTNEIFGGKYSLVNFEYMFYFVPNKMCTRVARTFMNNEFRRNESFRKLCIIAIRSLCFRMKTRIRFSNKILIKYLSIIHDISLNS